MHSVAHNTLSAHLSHHQLSNHHRQPPVSMFSWKLYKSQKYLYLIVLTSNLLFLIVGFTFVASSPILPRLEGKSTTTENELDKPITTMDFCLIGSLLPAGGILGMWMSAYTAFRFGRKKSLMIVCTIPIIAAHIIFAFAANVYLYFVARVLVGVAISTVYQVVPMYLVEVATAAMRQRICISMISFETFGELLMYCIGPYLKVRILCYIVIGLTGIIVLLMLFLPESPYFLVATKRTERAKHSLTRLRQAGADIRNELQFIQTTVEEAVEQEGSFADLFRSKATAKASLTVVALIAMQQWSGIVPILFYAQDICATTRSFNRPEIFVMIIAMIQFLSTFISSGFVERGKRRKILCISTATMLLAHSVVGTHYFLMVNAGLDQGFFFWMAPLSLMLYIASHTLGFGPVVWTIAGELYPRALRRVVNTTASFVWWLTALSTSFSYYLIKHKIGMYAVFWIYAGDCLLAMMFVACCLVETRGRTYEDIEEQLN